MFCEKVLIFEKQINNIRYKSRKPTKGPELDLTNEFIESVQESYNHKENRLALFIEPKIFSNYPDIVMAEFHPKIMDKWIDKRMKLGLNEFLLLSLLSNKSILSFQKILNITQFSEKNLIQSIELLIDCRMIQRKNEKWSLTNKRELFTLKKISAIEAKINNWKSALEQASLNIGYANESFILSNVQKPTNTTVQNVKDKGIGIYNMINNKANIICEPRKFPMSNSHTVWQLNEWIGRKLYQGKSINAS